MWAILSIGSGAGWGEGHSSALGRLTSREHRTGEAAARALGSAATPPVGAPSTLSTMRKRETLNHARTPFAHSTTRPTLLPRTERYPAAGRDSMDSTGSATAIRITCDTLTGP